MRKYHKLMNRSRADKLRLPKRAHDHHPARPSTFLQGRIRLALSLCG